MILNEIHLNELKSQNQKINASVELFSGSTLVKECTCEDLLSDFQIERSGEGKFFGYGICQKVKVSLADINKEINENNIDSLEVAFVVNEDALKPYPIFYKDTIERDETTNLLTINAFDCIYNTSKYTFEDLRLSSPYTLLDIINACKTIIGASGLTLIGIEEEELLKSYDVINVEGHEYIRQILNAIAEATQTIYYIDGANNLCLKRLDAAGAPLYTIGQEEYITLFNYGARSITGVCHVTELGDNVLSGNDTFGVIQYVRNNPIWEVEENIGEVIDNALSKVSGITISEFDCDWMGNYLLEIGDKIAFVLENGETIISYYLDDTISYTGTLSQLTRWSYEENSAETPANPTTLGEVLNRTSARVDKINREIELLASEISANKESIATLVINTNEISAKVTETNKNLERIEETTNEQLETLETEIKQLPDMVKIEIKEEIKAEGIDSVETSTGYTFNKDGLTVEKEGTEIKTQITENGMQVFKKSEAVLTANNEGVKAADLHANTYIWIGAYSRLEDYGYGRTGCFYVGE